MDPLVIVGCVGKGVDAPLVDGYPIAAANFLTDTRAQFCQVANVDHAIARRAKAAPSFLYAPGVTGPPSRSQCASSRALVLVEGGVSAPPLMEAAPFSDEPLQKRRGLPVIAKPFAVLVYPREHRR